MWRRRHGHVDRRRRSPARTTSSRLDIHAHLKYVMLLQCFGVYTNLGWQRAVHPSHAAAWHPTDVDVDEDLQLVVPLRWQVEPPASMEARALQQEHLDRDTAAVAAVLPAVAITCHLDEVPCTCPPVTSTCPVAPRLQSHTVKNR